MNITEIQQFLKGVTLAHFSQEHKLPLRTLVRIKAGTIPRAGTHALVAKAIKKSQDKAEKAKKAAA